MKATEMLNILKLARPALATSSFIPAYKQFHIDEGVVTATNGVLAITVVSDLDFSGIPNGDLTIKMLESLGEKEIEVSKGKGDELILKTGRSRFKLQCIPEDSYVLPEFEEFEEETAIPTDFITGLRACLPSVGMNPARPEQMGIAMVEQDGKVVLYSTDNATIARYVTNMDSSGLELPLILPRDFCDGLIVLTSKFKETAYLSLSSTEVSVQLGEDAMIATTLIEGNVPDFKSILDNFSEDELTVIPEDMDEVFSRANYLVGSDPEGVVQVTVSDGVVDFITKADTGESKESISIKHDWDVGEFKLHPATALRGLRAAPKISILNGAMMISDESKFTLLVSYIS